MTKAEGKVMYLGPTIRGVVKYGDVFEGGIPKKLSKVAEKKPIVKNLIVPLSKITDVEKEISTEGTAEAVAFDRIGAFTSAEIKEIVEGE